jgi:hypothetical protein
VLSISSDGDVVELPEHIITQHETTTSLFVEEIARIVFYATDPMTTNFDGEKIKAAVEAGIAIWGAMLPFKLLEMVGLPASIFTQQAASQSETATKTDRKPPTPET